MSCSVNLVPSTRLTTRARTRRRAAWLGACIATSAVVAAGWMLHRTAAGTLDNVARRLEGLESRRAQVHRELATHEAERSALLQKLETIAHARHPQPWARRLAQLTELAPGEICLTGIEVSPAGERDLARRRARPVAETAAAPPNASGQGQPPAAQLVRLTGYALNHAALIQLFSLLQGIPEWGEVELVRATSEKGALVSFELACLAPEEPS